MTRPAERPYFLEGVEYIEILDGDGHYLQLPKLTTAQRDALSATEGMMIYNTDTGRVAVYQDGGWVEIQPWVITGTTLNFFLSDDAADIGSYYYMYPTESGNGYSELTSPSLSTGDDQLLWSFVTEAGEPGVEVLALGAYTTTLFLKKTGNKDVRVYWKLFKRDTEGTETEILQSAVSDYLTTDNSQYLISAYLNEDQTLGPTDRLVLKLFANVSGTGTDVTVTLTMEGDYDSRLTINVLSSAFNLDRLSDVTITSPSNDELLAYDSGSGKWVNQTPSEAGVLAADGSVPLTADWDIGDGRKVLADEIRARDAAGLKLYDDDGKGVFVRDGGNVGVHDPAPDKNLSVTGGVEVRGGLSLYKATYSETFVSPDTNAHQGYTTDGTYHFLTDTTRIDKRNDDATWSLVTQNTDPFSGLDPAYNHLGDGVYYNGKLYIPMQAFTDCTTYSLQSIGIFNASTLAREQVIDISAQGHEVAGLTIVPFHGTNGVIYVISYCDGTKIWKYDLSTFTYLGTITLSQALYGAQGIAYKDGYFYISASGKIYVVDLDGMVCGSIDAPSGGQCEGLDYSQSEIRWLIDNGTSDKKVHYLSPTFSSNTRFFPLGGFTTDGPMGIGTPDPQTIQHIKDAANNVTVTIETQKFDGLAGIKFINDAQEWRINAPHGPAGDAFTIEDVTVAVHPFVIEAGHSVEAVRLRSTGYTLDVTGDIHCTGKLTSDGGNDPPYVLYNYETRTSIIDRVKKEVLPDKLNGAVLFFNGDQGQLELFLPSKGEFRSLDGKVLEKVEPIMQTFETENYYYLDTDTGEIKTYKAKKRVKRHRLKPDHELDHKTGKIKRKIKEKKKDPKTGKEIEEVVGEEEVTPEEAIELVKEDGR